MNEFDYFVAVLILLVYFNDRVNACFTWASRLTTRMAGSQRARIDEIETNILTCIPPSFSCYLFSLSALLYIGSALVAQQLPPVPLPGPPRRRVVP
jgi:hypothetical protein